MSEVKIYKPLTLVTTNWRLEQCNDAGEYTVLFKDKHLLITHLSKLDELRAAIEAAVREACYGDD